MSIFLTLLGIIGAYVLLKSKTSLVKSMTDNKTPAPSAPTSSYEAQFQAATRAAGGLQNLPYRAVFIQSHLETGGGTSNVLRTYHNGFGVHSDGAPNQFWDGQSYLTAAGENMRVYKSLDLSVSDYTRLIQRKYPRCVMAAESGDVKGYFQGLAEGGYAADKQYYAKLLSRYKEVYGVDA